MSTSLRLHIGSMVDVYSVDDNEWYQATIINYDTDEIKVRYAGDSDSEFDELLQIDSNSNNIAPLHCNTLNFIPLNVPSPKISISNHRNKCIYNKLHHSILLISVDIPGAKMIHQYDILNNEWSTFASYASLASSIKSITINTEKSVLYIFGTGCSGCAILDTFDIKKRELISSKQIDFQKCCNIFNPHLVCIPSPFNSLHLLSTVDYQKASHFQVDTNKAKLSLCTKLEFEAKSVAFCKATKQLIAVNNFGSIYLCDLNANRSFCEWTELQMGIDIEIDACFAYLAFSHFLFMFVMVYNENEERQAHEMWFVDLLEHKVFKSHKKAHEMLFEYSFVGTMDATNNALHILMDDEESLQHFKLCLVDNIPREMNQFYQQKHCKKLVFGYIEQVFLSSSIPLDIMHLILAFYPPFL